MGRIDRPYDEEGPMGRDDDVVNRALARWVRLAGERLERLRAEGAPWQVLGEAMEEHARALRVRVGYWWDRIRDSGDPPRHAE